MYKEKLGRRGKKLTFCLPTPYTERVWCLGFIPKRERLARTRGEQEVGDPPPLFRQEVFETPRAGEFHIDTGVTKKSKVFEERKVVDCLLQLTHSSICREDDDRTQGRLKNSVQKSKALNVEHMDLQTQRAPRETNDIPTHTQTDQIDS